MSSFYYCNDCKKAVDLLVHRNDMGKSYRLRHHCKECSGTNWKAVIDSPNGETEDGEE